MSEDTLHNVKNAVLAHIQSVFEEAEEVMAMQHQEKFALLEDACENATDVDELRVAFEQWYQEHAEDLELEDAVHELWENAVAVAEDGDPFEEDEDEV